MKFNTVINCMVYLIEDCERYDLRSIGSLPEPST